MHRRIGSIIGAAALAATALVATTAQPAAAADLTPSATTVAVGGQLTVQADGCEDQGPAGTHVAEVVLVTGTGASAVLAASGISGPSGFTLTVPGWVDPARPAVLAGSCTQYAPNEPPIPPTASVAFTFADVPIDVTAGTGPAPTLAVDRTTAAQGQLVRVTAAGCPSGTDAAARLTEPGDLTGRSHRTPRAATEPGAGTGFQADLDLNEQRVGPGTYPGRLAEGDYVLTVECVAADGTAPLSSRPVAIHVVGTNPTDTLAVDVPTYSHRITITGQGCSGGRTVALHLTGDRPAVDRTVTPAADGSWRTVVEIDDYFTMRVVADCGDPRTTGFRYVPQDAVGGGPSTPTTTTPTTTTPDGVAPAATGAQPVAGSPSYTG